MPHASPAAPKALRSPPLVNQVKAAGGLVPK